MNNFAFWPYDLFPYVCAGVIKDPVRVHKGQASAYSTTYGTTVCVWHQETEAEGREIMLKIAALSDARTKELKQVEEKYHKEILKVAPFLSGLPAYKGK